MIIIHNPAKLQEQLATAAAYLKTSSLDQLITLLGKTKHVNGDDPQAAPWIKLIEDEIAARPVIGHGCCQLCGEPMPTGETMFKFHGYSGPCPTTKP